LKRFGDLDQLGPILRPEHDRARLCPFEVARDKADLIERSDRPFGGVAAVGQQQLTGRRLPDLVAVSMRERRILVDVNHPAAGQPDLVDLVVGQCQQRLRHALHPLVAERDALTVQYEIGGGAARHPGDQRGNRDQQQQPAAQRPDRLAALRARLT